MDKNDKGVKKLENTYESHIEFRFHAAKKDIMSQLDAVIKINLNLNEVCEELCTKYKIDEDTFKTWVQEQIPSITRVETESVVEEDDDE